MSNAVMPLAHYKETCDAIREKTGSTDTIKSREMPDKINDVFRAGQLGIVSSAEALKGSASGSSVTIKDISPVEHDVSVKLSGLPPVEADGTTIALPTPTNYDDGAMKCTVDNGTITIEVNGARCQNTANYYIAENLVLPAGKYVLSGIQSVAITDDIRGMWAHNITIFNSDNGNQIASWEFPKDTEEPVTNKTFTLDEETKIGLVYNYGSANVGETSKVVTVIKPQLKADVTYISADYSGVKVQRLGKNLLNAMEIASNNASTDYVKDVENNAFTLRGNEGGQYLAGSGQLMLPYSSKEHITKKGIKVKGGVKYTVSFDLLIIEQGVYNSNISLLIYTSALGNIPAGIVEGTLGTTVRRSITFTPTTDEIISFCFRINNNYVTLSNIQVEEGSMATEFEPYIEPVEFSANADGTVQGNTYLYPSMTLTSDTEGVIITTEYIKDIDKAFEERLAALEAAIVNNE